MVLLSGAVCNSAAQITGEGVHRDLISGAFSTVGLFFASKSCAVLDVTVIAGNALPEFFPDQLLSVSAIINIILSFKWVLE